MSWWEVFEFAQRVAQLNGYHLTTGRCDPVDYEPVPGQLLDAYAEHDLPALLRITAPTNPQAPPPVAGTPAWCALPDGDARKLLALLLRGVQAALADDTRQAGHAETSREISAMEPWRSLGTRMIRGRGPRYIPRQRQESPS